MSARRKITKQELKAFRDLRLAGAALRYVEELAHRPCQIGHVDRRRCWAHADDWARAQWCEPCEAENVLRQARKIDPENPEAGGAGGELKR